MDCKVYFYLVDYQGVDSLYGYLKKARGEGRLNNVTDVERETKKVSNSHFFMREGLDIKKESEKLLKFEKRVNITKENPYYFLIMMAPY